MWGMSGAAARTGEEEEKKKKEGIERDGKWCIRIVYPNKKLDDRVRN